MKKILSLSIALVMMAALLPSAAGSAQIFESFTVTFVDWDGTVLKTQDFQLFPRLNIQTLIHLVNTFPFPDHVFPGHPHGNRYYGSYNGAEVFARIGVTAVMTYIDVAGHTFVYSSGARILVYKDTSYADIRDAYTEGWLTDQDIYDIWRIHNAMPRFSVSIAAPLPPMRMGYTFAGWDVPFSDPTGDLTVTAQYVPFNPDAPITLTLRPVPGTPAELEPGDTFTMEVHLNDPGRMGIGFISDLTITFDSDVLEWSHHMGRSNGRPFFRGPVVGNRNTMELILPAHDFPAHARFNFASAGSVTVTGVILLLDFKVKDTAPPGVSPVNMVIYSSIGYVTNQRSFQYIPGKDYNVVSSSVNIGPVIDTAILYGDVDGDGQVNSADITLLRRYIASGLTPQEFVSLNPAFNAANADVNGDGDIDAEDVTLLRQYIAAPAAARHTITLGRQ
jgi:hypothetical protein